MLSWWTNIVQYSIVQYSIIEYISSEGVVIWSLNREVFHRDFHVHTVNSVVRLEDKYFSVISFNIGKVVTDTRKNSLTDPITEDRPSIGPVLKKMLPMKSCFPYSTNFSRGSENVTHIQTENRKNRGPSYRQHCSAEVVGGAVKYL